MRVKEESELRGEHYSVLYMSCYDHQYNAEEMRHDWFLEWMVLTFPHWMGYFAATIAAILCQFKAASSPPSLLNMCAYASVCFMET